MFFHILNIITPIFLVVAAGYIAVRQNFLTNDIVDGLMKFTLLFAIPCLLFNATSTMNLSTAYDWRLMLAFYCGATLSFILASLIAWKRFDRPPGEAVAVGFGGLFSNLVLIGLPISERAWGTEQITPVYAIISLHAPYCYLIGITTMELLRSDGRSLLATAQVVVKSMFRNSMMIGIGLGFLVNFSGVTLPETITDATTLLAKAALPTALFGLGGVLVRYKMADSLSEAGSIALISLFVHPTLTWIVCQLLGVEDHLMRVVVLIAAMAPGMNAYMFATLYQRGQGTIASLVLLATAVSVVSVSFWLWLMM
ncbi:MAG: malonate transporter [Proteobacteria bacterium]|nr:MAG: malonate transporter [Pseudomonadota bacterium]